MSTTTLTKIGLQTITTGTEEGTWGDIMNTNLESVDRSFGATEHTSIADANVNLSYANTSPQNALVFVVPAATTLTANRNVTMPSGTTRVQGFSNLNGDGFSITVQQTGGTGNVVVADGYTVVARGTLTGDGAINALGNLMTLGVTGQAVQIVPGGGTATLDCSAGNYHYATISGAVTWTFSKPPATGHAYRFQLELTNGGAGLQTWPGSVQWPGGTPPTLQAAGLDIIDFVTRDGGTTYNGYLSMSNLS